MKNKYKIIGNEYAEVYIISKGKSYTMLVDIPDLQILSTELGKINVSQGYARARCTNLDKDVLVHRYIKKCTDDMVIDHINHNRMDNRSHNLREVSQLENIRNNKVRKDNELRIKGVHYNKGKYSAKIGVNGDCVHLGTYDTPVEAARVRVHAEMIHFNSLEVTRTAIKLK